MRPIRPPGTGFAYKGWKTSQEENAELAARREAERAALRAPAPVLSGGDMNYPWQPQSALRAFSWTDWRRQQGLSPTIPGLGRVLF